MLYRSIKQRGHIATFGLLFHKASCSAIPYAAVPFYCYCVVAACRHRLPVAVISNQNRSIYHSSTAISYCPILFFPKAQRLPSFLMAAACCLPASKLTQVVSSLTLKNTPLPPLFWSSSFNTPFVRRVPSFFRAIKNSSPAEMAIQLLLLSQAIFMGLYLFTSSCNRQYKLFPHTYFFFLVYTLFSSSITA